MTMGTVQNLLKVEGWGMGEREIFWYSERGVIDPANNKLVKLGVQGHLGTLTTYTYIYICMYLYYIPQ